MIYFSTLLLSMFITIGLIPIFSRVALKLNVVDIPNERKVHTNPIPRIGGMAMALGVLLPFLIQDLISQTHIAILLGTIIIVAFGAVDDMFGLGHRIKFVGQIAAALVLILYGKLSIVHLGTCLPENCHIPWWLAVPLTLVTIVAVTNAVNLADGLDGLAGGIMLQAFICLCIMGIHSHNSFVTIISLGVIGSIFGFLRFNTYPAKIFMGDTGSQMLGFLAIALALSITQTEGPLSPLIPLLLLGFPILDTAVVMIERARRGISPFKADRNHFHHKLLDIGFFHTETVFVVYSIQALFVASAYLLRFYSEWFIIFFYLGLVLFIIGPFYLASLAGVQLRRQGFVDTFIKEKLRVHVKEKSVLLRIIQPTLEYGIPFIFLYSAFIPADIPLEISFISLFLFAALSADLWFQSKYIGAMIRVAAYLILPLVIFQCMQQTAPWFDTAILKMYIISFTGLALLTIMILKLTRRRKGFRPTPTDYLIVLIAIVLAHMPQQSFASDQVGFWGTCLLVFFFSVEVLLGEVRDKVRRTGFLLLPSLLVLIARGI